jgi:hypothetical protein
MAIASSMTSYITSNFITGDSLEENVRIEASIASVREHNFGDDAKPDVKAAIDLDDGRRVQLNQTRLRVCIAAWGPNPNNWVGKTVIISRGKTMYAGKPTACVVVEPVVATRIAAAEAKSALERRGSATIESGKHAAPREQAPPPKSEADYGVDEPIPF